MKDAETLRVKLFGQNGRWRIFGQSYGAFIVHRYLEVAPEHIDKAYAHGNALGFNQVEKVTMRIESQQRVAKDYFKIYPEDEKIIFKIRSLIPESRCFSDEHNLICGPGVLDASASSFLLSPSHWKDLHGWLNYFLIPPDFKNIYEPNLLKWITYFTFGDNTENEFLFEAINRVEREEDDGACQKATHNLEALGEFPTPWAINECRLLHAFLSEYSSYVRTISARDPLTLDGFITAFDTLKGSVPFYLYSGHLDPIVPEGMFQKEVGSLSRHTGFHYENFRMSGHDGYESESNVWRDLSQ